MEANNCMDANNGRDKSCYQRHWQKIYLCEKLLAGVIESVQQFYASIVDTGKNITCAINISVFSLKGQ